MRLKTRALKIILENYRREKPSGKFCGSASVCNTSVPRPEVKETEKNAFYVLFHTLTYYTVCSDDDENKA